MINNLLMINKLVANKEKLAREEPESLILES